MKYQSPPRYQKDEQVYRRQVTAEFKPILRVFQSLPSRTRLLDIACAEGFLCWLASYAGVKHVTGIEIGKNKVELGRKHLSRPGVRLICGDVWDNLELVDEATVFVVSKFFHNVTEEEAEKLMCLIGGRPQFLLIVRHKPGPKKETGAPREKYATNAGVSALMAPYVGSKKSFPSQLVIGARGQYYVELLERLKREMGAG